MLPLPVSLSSLTARGGRLGHRYSRSTHDVLRTRARVTNLSVLLLALSLPAPSSQPLVLLCLVVFLRPRPRVQAPQRRSRGHMGTRRAVRTPWAMWETVARDRKLEGLDHLVLVPGHAVWTGNSVEEGLDEDHWILEPYQRGGGRVQAFVRHILAASDIARADTHALLVFSGGQTRLAATSTEAESYLRLAHLSSLLPSASSPAASPHTPVLRATTEEHALDSFQNLLFSLARFREYTGRWPARVTVVGYEMKRRRFAELHRAALRWPADRFEYVGIDPDGEDAATAAQGELQNGYKPYREDLYGCHGVLLAKRRSRNPFSRFHSYYSSTPEIGPLLNWCPGRPDGGQTEIYPGPLPWDEPK
ncbi:uncharacterized protein BXZ73DRAFT_55524 [Epithele typhae]|uniref:uncharacterized protein n=1 Tax=Epithele typhae TaxID=378194 RepID=UPI0020072E21|nr:uncharacterized protein BXZ73DRAFT_55524 [Epithele typhae]KAH9913471.1 hypothetical protein BXZ73DRAFT_55524 [Epithele typhae]